MPPSRRVETRIANLCKGLPPFRSSGTAADFSCKKIPRLRRFGLTELAMAG
jgi:hypothetical protein